MPERLDQSYSYSVFGNVSTVGSIPVNIGHSNRKRKFKNIIFSNTNHKQLLHFSTLSISPKPTLQSGGFRCCSVFKIKDGLSSKNRYKYHGKVSNQSQSYMRKYAQCLHRFTLFYEIRKPLILHFAFLWFISISHPARRGKLMSIS
jgi:hypothetical protein